jgi:hypothetical protein
VSLHRCTRCPRMTNQDRRICSWCAAFRGRPSGVSGPRGPYGPDDIPADEIERIFQLAKQQIRSRRSA